MTNKKVNIIGFCGCARAGKDTTASFLQGYRRHAFADILKQEVMQMLSSVGVNIDLTDEATKIEWREMLVLWGKQRRAMQPDYWIRKLEEVVLAGEDENISITDVRYKNEVEWIQSMGGAVIYITRPGFEPPNDEERNSLFEIAMHCQPAMVTILNDSSVEDLKEKLDNALLQL